MAANTYNCFVGTYRHRSNELNLISKVSKAGKALHSNNPECI